jgi:hypothetical protein
VVHDDPAHRREQDHRAAVFVAHGTAARTAYFAVSVPVLYLGDRKVRRHHKRLAVLGELAVIGVETSMTDYNVRHGKGW